MTLTPHHVTLEEVAKAAGVSIATASRAINGSTRRVNEQVKKHVEEVAARLGYLPNLSAQTVAKGASPTIAVLVADIADPYFSTIAAGVLDEASEHGMMVTMAVGRRRAEDELAAVRTFRSQRPQAIIVTGSRHPDSPQAEAFNEQLQAYAAAGGRVVVISQGPSPYDLIEIRNREGARQLAEALVARGGQRFGIVTGHRKYLTNEDRVRGFREGLKQAGIELDDDAVVEADFTREGGYAGAEELLRRSADLDTIFATSDLMAIGAGTALRDAGLTPGEDVSLAGFDDIALARDVTPPLTTVRVPLSTLGQQAVELALRPKEDEEPAQVSIDTEVILRASTPQR
ncbi:LacI family DNA-binding transcriptional regulator [Nesterenkonia alba]|uniref:LacI family DNA-binding transcriptional regulator n=1 Tax=Nesterenkonia alba TaxID=515814 RepID=UPI0003B5F9AF|nr:LacI family DNA-binding transcriptional regulator [Nesterenkonia alba]